MADNIYSGFGLGGTPYNGILANSPYSTGDDSWTKNLPEEGVSKPAFAQDQLNYINDTESRGRDMRHAVGGALYNMRTQDGENAPQAPDDPSQVLNDKVNQLQSDVRGALNPEAQQKSPQDEGAQAFTALQDQAKASVQEVKDAQQKGGNLVPDVSQDPAAHLAQRNQNIAVGVGDSTGTLNPKAPKALTPEQTDNATLSQAGNQTSLEMNKVSWWQSDSFNRGLLAFGLNLLSGKSLGEAFAVGSQIFDQHYAGEQRAAWAQDLQQRGYDPVEIQRYIETGDNKVLTSPQERAAKLQQQQQLQQMNQLKLQQAQLQLGADQFNLDPAVLQQNNQIKNDYMAAQTEQMRGAANKFQNSDEYQGMQKQLLQAQIDKARADATNSNNKANFAGQIGGINVVDLPNGMKANVAGAEIVPGYYPLVDSKGKIQGDSRWIKTVNPETGRQMQVPVNMQMYEIAGRNAQNTLDRLAKFSEGYGSFIGPSGEVKRNLYDFFANRSTEDMGSMAHELQGFVDNLAESRATLESGGFKPTNMSLQNAKASFPEFGEWVGRGEDRHFVPTKMSKERFAQAVQSIGQQASELFEMSHRYSSPDQREALANTHNIVQPGQRMRAPDGKWYIAQQPGLKTDSIWKLDPNQ